MQRARDRTFLGQKNKSKSTKRGTRYYAHKSERSQGWPGHHGEKEKHSEIKQTRI